MFFDYIRNQWLEGKVQIGKPAIGLGNGISVHGSILPGIAALLLSTEEKRELADLVKEKALRIKNESNQ